MENDNLQSESSDIEMTVICRDTPEDILRSDLGCREEEYSSQFYDPDEIINLSSILNDIEDLQTEIIRECDTDSDKQEIGLHDFELLKYLATGGFAKVFQVRKLNGNDKDGIFAMKVLRKALVIRSEKEIEHTLAERSILENINHPFIVDLKYAFQSASKLYLVMEYLSGGDLFTYLSRERCFSEDATRFYVSEMVLALEYLHSKNIIYRDLKPENILFDWEGHIKLTDFGLGKQYLREGEITSSFCGTYEYMAPEIISKKGHGRGADWWSLGAVMYEMITGDTPFGCDSTEKIRIRTLTRRPKIPRYLTRHAQDFIRKLLKKDPRNRLGALPMGTLAVKQHLFFKNVSWADVFDRKLEPPYKPLLHGNDDVKYFDKIYTERTPVDSFVDVISESDDAVFRGFSYISPSLHETIQHSNLVIANSLEGSSPDSSPSYAASSAGGSYQSF